MPTLKLAFLGKEGKDLAAHHAASASKHKRPIVERKAAVDMAGEPDSKHRVKPGARTKYTAPRARSATCVAST